ncbi:MULTISPECIES: alpha/beta fold hydrolase [unclassified Paenibacillus]|uniref:alpha/beta hydrolase n=1 Tax=unclassified Paenibacillus TaxID=185978 RepID=UPI002406EE85|nr:MULTISPECIES: alpha/beta fold hydrolase [unclassified Paenibacillus]MDF9844698.1 pimeloyl-ACP methyl ester carboxylesterase [Paenibacillus sp. PastF-2]MDF9851300.1 pimeloyl-ACP methyl ester carboxylesterase [Paenibacillus sp. PastM-2]MDF9857883.1 pimeloyl-ACP methyl ester carboxylesterase [Paenibacillus sp. PastF-1]MDH6483149.1 pimeloyl-ACP methyl ester carboxylesterase [Paenibacillus sp. PastH-2]MDH6510594.1 pimeloyl-ACP methyl ester carboxylesterase [Paenibacillus sp. PastM-3]
MDLATLRTGPPVSHKPDKQKPGAAHQISLRMIRVKHIIVALLLSVFFFFVFCFIALHGYIAWVLSNPTVAPLYSTPMIAKGLEYEDVSFPAQDGSRTMQGWYIPSEGSTKTIVFSHGYGANREESWVPMYDLAHYAHSLNFNVVMFDYGFASQINKDIATGGKKESQQLLGAINFAKERGAREIVVWGFSMGAGTALQAGLVTKDVDAMILDSTFLLEPDTLYHNIKQNIDLPRQPSLEIMELLFPVLNGTGLNQIPYAKVKKEDYPFPILFMHGTKDDKAPYPIAEELAANQSNPYSDSWIIEDSHHELLFREHPREYLRRVSAFLGNVQLAQSLEGSKTSTASK